MSAMARLFRSLLPVKRVPLGSVKAREIQEAAAEAIREWAAPDAGFGWVGASGVAEHADELACWLYDRGLLRWLAD